MNRLGQSTFLIAVLLLACPMAYSQDSGAITGRVTDPTGAVVPGAAVTVTQTELNYENKTVTNGDGLYRVLSLRPGPYRVSVTAAGFEHLIREGISLRTDETLDIDLTLKLGAATESVEVTGAATLLQTETSATGLVLDGNYINDLPIYQRRELSALYFSPGISMAYTSNGALAGLTAFSINGLPKTAVGYFEDGVQVSGASAGNPIMGSIEELKVVSTVPPAEYGHAGGGFVTVIKKFGTNDFHGTLSEIGRDRIMTERKYFDEYRNSQIYPGHPTPDGYFEQYPEGSVTGPVYIPKVYNGKNKTFFMFTLQRQQESQFHQTPFTAPDANMLAGNFSFGGIGQPIYDPRTTIQSANGTWSRSPFPGDIIPVNQISPVAVKLLSYNPFRTANDALGSVGTTGPANNVFYSQDARQNVPQYAARLDQQFSPAVKTFLSWTRYKTDAEPERSGTVAYFPFDSNNVYSPSWIDNYSSGTTWVVTPTLLAELHLGYVRTENITDSPASYNQNIAGLLGIPGLPATAFPLGLYTGIGGAAPSSTIVETLSMRPDVSKVQGRHTLKAGYELLRFREDAWTVGTPDGTFTLDNDVGLNSNGVATPNTGNAFAGFLTGAVDSATFTTRLKAELPRAWQNSFYVQDDWKVSPTITVNIGVRYSLETSPVEKQGWSENFEPNVVDPSSNSYVFSNGFTCPPGGCMGAYVHTKGLSPWGTYGKNIDPRFGIAWHALPKLVVRSGFGKTMIDNRFTYLDTDEEVLNTFTQAQPAGNPAPLYYIQQGPGPITYPAVRADGSAPYVGVPSGHTATWYDPHLKNPYTMTWNFNLQYELSRNYVVSAIYSGSSSVDLTGTMQVNTIPYGYDLNNPTALAAWIPVAQYSRPFPNWGNIGYVGNFGHADHHEATISLEKRLSGGLNFTAFYTFSKSIDGTATEQGICTCLDKAVSVNNNKNLLSATSTYQLPVGQGRRFWNRKGWKDYVFGGFNLTLNYSLRSGGPLSIGTDGGAPFNGLTGAPTLNYPAFVANWGNVMLDQDPQLRADWKDLGGDRFNQSNENSLLNCTPTKTGAVLTSNPSQPCFTYVPSYGMGNDGRDITNSQRIIAFAFSATKEIKIKERLRFQLRYDFQNPFKWYTLNAPTTTLALGSPTLYGKVSLDAGTANLGGQPLMNLGFAFLW